MEIYHNWFLPIYFKTTLRRNPKPCLYNLFTSFLQVSLCVEICALAYSNAYFFDAILFFQTAIDDMINKEFIR